MLPKWSRHWTPLGWTHTTLDSVQSLSSSNNSHLGLSFPHRKILATMHDPSSTILHYPAMCGFSLILPTQTQSALDYPSFLMHGCTAGLVPALLNFKSRPIFASQWQLKETSFPGATEIIMTMMMIIHFLKLIIKTSLPSRQAGVKITGSVSLRGSKQKVWPLPFQPAFTHTSGLCVNNKRDMLWAMVGCSPMDC